MVIDGDRLRANKTTLGGDDGIAIAYGLAILDADDIPHPPIELLVTTNEETGMDGAMALTSDHLSGTRLLNLDTEEEGIFLVSCSGGANIDSTIEMAKEANSSDVYEIVLSGLKGGHSGSEIICQRGNAIKMLARILSSVKDDIRLARIEGGIKHNAVPSYARALVATDKFDKIEETIKSMIDDLTEEYRVEEPDFKATIVKSQAEQVYTKESSDKVIDFLMILPDGVQYMSKDIDGLVQTSLNNAIIAEVDGNLVLTTSVRSAATSSLREILDRINSLGKVMDIKTREYAAYPAWQFDANSELRDIAIETYKAQYGEEPEVSSIHAGLECGLLKGILPDCDMLSYGPDIRDAHTPLESMGIESVARVWEFTKNLLANLK